MIAPADKGDGMSDIIISIFTFIFGTLVGSFLNVVILRLPQNESIVLPASHCPDCEGSIQWYDNVPLVSFILLRGRCRLCSNPISWQYPIVELAMGLLSLALYLKFSLSLSFAIYFLPLSFIILKTTSSGALIIFFLCTS